MGSLSVEWVSQRVAFDWVELVHRHHRPPRGAILCVAARRDGVMVGVGILGRPVSRVIQNAAGLVFEVTRVATDGSPNVCSKIYGALARIARELGALRIITYTLDTEPGTSLHAAGWVRDGAAGGGSWSRQSRMRLDPNPTTVKTRWSRTFGGE